MTTGNRERADESLPLVYQALKLYREVHHERGFDQYPNGLLYRIAVAKPSDANEIAELLPDEDLYHETGPELIEVVKLFTASHAVDSVNARARAKLEQVELLLYELVVDHLKSKFKEDWWFRGVPESIRVRAAQLYEESAGGIAKESALYLRDLKEIALAEWGGLKEQLADPNESKRQFESRFGLLLDLRNRLSHPVRLKESPVQDDELNQLDEWLDAVDT